jgi:hypothetical protein
MTTRFVGDPEIATSFAPFDSMRSNSASTNSPLREQMRKLVSKRPIDLIMNHRVLLSLLRDNVTGTR